MTAKTIKLSIFNEISGILMQDKNNPLLLRVLGKNAPVKEEAFTGTVTTSDDPMGEVEEALVEAVKHCAALGVLVLTKQPSFVEDDDGRVEFTFTYYRLGPVDEAAKPYLGYEE